MPPAKIHIKKAPLAKIIISLLLVTGGLFRAIDLFVNYISSHNTKELLNATQSLPFKIFATLILGLMGYYLYILREEKRLAYSVLEMGAALATLFFAINKLATDPVASTLGILGGLYIVVRACDNFSKWEDNPKNNQLK